MAVISQKECCEVFFYNDNVVFWKCVLLRIVFGILLCVLVPESESVSVARVSGPVAMAAFLSQVHGCIAANFFYLFVFY